MKEEFRSKRFSPEKRVLLDKVVEIVEDYAAQGIRMTLRQLYYQLVARDIIANNLKEYAKLSGLLTDARYCGEVDWEAIEDRVRVPKIPTEFEDLSELVEAAKHSYRLPRWEGQEYYVELFTEKDALSSVLEPIARKYHITFNVNRGYSSASAMYDASKRFLESEDKDCILLYIGDHDPSGLDMIRDIGARLDEFGADVEVKPLALTAEQIQKYKPPPNPAKFSDPRAADYIARFGRTSWEVDALPPDVLNKIVENAILEFLDGGKMNAIIAKEKKELEALEKFAKTLVRKEKHG